MWMCLCFRYVVAEQDVLTPFKTPKKPTISCSPAPRRLSLSSAYFQKARPNLPIQLNETLDPQIDIVRNACYAKPKQSIICWMVNPKQSIICLIVNPSFTKKPIYSDRCPQYHALIERKRGILPEKNDNFMILSQTSQHLLDGES